MIDRFLVREALTGPRSKSRPFHAQLRRMSRLETARPHRPSSLAETSTHQSLVGLRHLAKSSWSSRRPPPARNGEHGARKRLARLASTTRLPRRPQPSLNRKPHRPPRRPPPRNPQQPPRQTPRLGPHTPQAAAPAPRTGTSWAMPKSGRATTIRATSTSSSSSSIRARRRSNSAP